jgi:hypothetical protein
MDKPSLPDRFQEGLERHLLFLGISVLIGIAFIGLHNVVTPDQSVEVGYVEVETECAGLDVGICLGLQKQTHTTYNYDNYTVPEEGTEDFYRRVEAELMAQAYNICDSETSGMEWTSEAEYRNQTGDEWRENENVTLLPCEQTTWREMEN